MQTKRCAWGSSAKWSKRIVSKTATMALATEFANGPQVSMRLLKRSVYNAAELSFEQALDEIASKTAISDHHPDAREGVAAFRDKRTASFNAWLDPGSKQSH